MTALYLSLRDMAVALAYLVPASPELAGRHCIVPVYRSSPSHSLLYYICSQGSGISRDPVDHSGSVYSFAKEPETDRWYSVYITRVTGRESNSVQSEYCLLHH
jgi:hypothetical protein